MEGKRKKNKLGDFFSIKRYEKGTLLYHGTFNYVKKDIWLPAYYSVDVLQSIGHVIVNYENVEHSLDEKNNNLTLTFEIS